MSLGSVIAVVFGIAFALLQVGIFAPVVRSHCFAGGGLQELRVETSWKIAIPLLGADDSQECARNTVAREGLAFLGIWDLGTPREQAEHAATESTEDVLGPAGQAYLSALLELRRQYDESNRNVAIGLATANTPRQYRDVVAEAADTQRDATDAMRDLDPPAEFTNFHTFAVESGDRQTELLDRMVEAIESGDGPAVRELSRKVDQEYERYKREYAEQVDALRTP